MATQNARFTLLAGAGLMAFALLAGCASKQDKALDQAKKQAVATNIPQQVQYIDNNGDTVTKTVEPPFAPGQKPAVSTLITPPPPGNPPHSTDPVITPLTSAAQGPPQPYGNSQPGSGNGQGGYGNGQPAPNGSGQAMGQPNQQNQAPAPVSLSVPAGTELAIRINQRISVKTTRAGDRFDGEVVEPVESNGNIIIPRGTPVSGRIDAAHRRGHFKGASILELRLTSMTLNGYQYPLDTRDNVSTKRGKGRRTAGFIGGMTGAGMLIGGLATGGVGLAIGGAAGAGAGTLLAGATGNKDIDIPAESIVHFRLADPLVIQQP
jgi:outer membrane murein-binding lipoprotein Lpp